MTNLTKIEYDFSLFEREGPQRHVAYFFNFDQKMFQASVSYWKSESKGPEREQVLKDIVQSLRHENNPPKSAGSQASPETNGASTVQVGAVSLWKTLINRAGWSVQCPPGWKVLSCTYCPDVTDPDVFSGVAYDFASDVLDVYATTPARAAEPAHHAILPYFMIRLNLFDDVERCP